MVGFDKEAEDESNNNDNETCFDGSFLSKKSDGVNRRNGTSQPKQHGCVSIKELVAKIARKPTVIFKNK